MQNWWSGLKAKEEAFWSRALKFREFSGYLYHGKDFHQLPILFVSLQNVINKEEFSCE